MSAHKKAPHSILIGAADMKDSLNNGNIISANQLKYLAIPPLNSSSSSSASVEAVEGMGSGHISVLPQSNQLLSYAASNRLSDLAQSRAPTVYLTGGVGSTAALLTPTFQRAAATVTTATTFPSPTSLLTIASLGGNRTLVSVSAPASISTTLVGTVAPAATTYTVVQCPAIQGITSNSNIASQNYNNSVEPIYNLSIRLPITKPKIDDTTNNNKERALSIKNANENKAINSEDGNNSLEINEQVETGSGMIRGYIAEQVISAISGNNATGSGNNSDNNSRNKTTGRLVGLGFHKPDDAKLQRIQKTVEGCISQDAKQQILQILDRVATLRPLEKLLLYLRLPSETPETDPLRQPQNPLGTRSEINHTINWVRTHVEQDSQVSIPKQDVYNDYMTFCDRLKIKPLSTADFGKVMKQVFPGIRPRRLGTRGHSRYCYAAMRKTSKLPAPELPQLFQPQNSLKEVQIKTEGDIKREPDQLNDQEGSSNTITIAERNAGRNHDDYNHSWTVVKQWAEGILHRKVDDLKSLAYHIENCKKTTPVKIEDSVNGVHSNNTLPDVLQVDPVETSNTNSSTSITNNNKKSVKLQRESKEKRPLLDIGPSKKRHKKKRKGMLPIDTVYQGQNSTIEMGKEENHSITSEEKIDDGKIKVKEPQEEKLVNLISEYRNNSESLITPRPVPIAIRTTPVTAQCSTLIPIYAQQTGAVTPTMTTAVTVTSTSLMSKGKVTKDLRNRNNISTHSTEQSVQTDVLNDEKPDNNHGMIWIPFSNIKTNPAEVKGNDGDGGDNQKRKKKNTANVFCKKVLKAQQIKGFGSCTSNDQSISPANVSRSPAVVPITTIHNVMSGNGEYILDTSSVTSSNLIQPSAASAGSLRMGPPPAQLITSTNTSTTSSLSNTFILQEDVSLAAASTSPKVISRNLQQLRVKKYLTPPSSTSSSAPLVNDSVDLSVVKDTTDLPENLGLPRERVISICNMDKHELDDYFLPVEEENSEDQETELLQYFQLNDKAANITADDGLSSVSGGGNPPLMPNNVTTTTTSSLTNLTPIGLTSTAKLVSGCLQNPNKSINANNNTVIAEGELIPSIVAANIFVTKSEAGSMNTATVLTSGSTFMQSLLPKQHCSQIQKQLVPHQSTLLGKDITTTTTVTTVTTTRISPTVCKTAIKRKLNINAITTASEITAARKSCSFLPISPSVNMISPALQGQGGGRLSLGGKCQGITGDGTVGLFASPNNTLRHLVKQQSLDCNSSDPMIGCGRRKRFVNVTSASAPPSPRAVLQQQQQQQHQHQSHEQQQTDDSLNLYMPLLLPDQWSPPSQSLGNNPHQSQPNKNSTTASFTSILADQNSLELDMLPTATLLYNSHSAGIIDLNDQSLSSFTQDLITHRSQSVPLSQSAGQRIPSPSCKRSFPFPDSVLTFSGTSKTPISTDFGDSTTTALMLSENSNCSQQSVNNLKLNEVNPLTGNNNNGGLLVDMDMAEMLSSSELAANLENRMTANSNTLNGAGVNVNTLMGNVNATGSNSVASSSSGYSSLSGGQLQQLVNNPAVFNTNQNLNGKQSGNLTGNVIISRSVPCTPLPQRCQPAGGGGNMGSEFGQRFDYLQVLNGVNPNTFLCEDGNNSDMLMLFANRELSGHSQKDGVMLSGGGGHGNAAGGGGTSSTKSMPSTPVTGPWNNFRYSPLELTRDFLINGNTVDGLSLTAGTTTTAASSTLAGGFMDSENNSLTDASLALNTPQLSSSSNLMIGNHQGDNCEGRTAGLLLDAHCDTNEIGGSGQEGRILLDSTNAIGNDGGKLMKTKQILDMMSSSAEVDESTISVIGGDLLGNL